MTITEVIKEFEELKNEYGDLEVRTMEIVDEIEMDEMEINLIRPFKVENGRMLNVEDEDAPPSFVMFETWVNNQGY